MRTPSQPFLQEIGNYKGLDLDTGRHPFASPVFMGIRLLLPFGRVFQINSIQYLQMPLCGRGDPEVKEAPLSLDANYSSADL